MASRGREVSVTDGFAADLDGTAARCLEQTGHEAPPTSWMTMGASSACRWAFPGTARASRAPHCPGEGLACSLPCTTWTLLTRTH